MGCRAQPVRYPISRTVQQMTRETRMGQPSYTEFRILPGTLVHPKLSSQVRRGAGSSSPRDPCCRERTRVLALLLRLKGRCRCVSSALHVTPARHRESYVGRETLNKACPPALDCQYPKAHPSLRGSLAPSKMPSSRIRMACAPPMAVSGIETS